MNQSLLSLRHQILFTVFTVPQFCLTRHKCDFISATQVTYLEARDKKTKSVGMLRDCGADGSVSRAGGICAE